RRGRLPVHGDRAERRGRKRRATIAVDRRAAADASLQCRSHGDQGARAPERLTVAKTPEGGGYVDPSTASSCSARNAISSSVPAVIRSAVGAPNDAIGRTITPCRRRSSFS